MSVGIEDFEELLNNDFNEQEFANVLLKSTNSNPNTSVLDIKTPIKKINYDIKEIDSREDIIIKENSSIMADQLYKENAIKDTVHTGLKSSLQYLDISYKRLQEHVMIPYAKAHKLQSILSKVHQTSNILRDALVYIHLANKIQEIMESDKKLSIEKATQLTTLYSQLQLTIQENVNLKSLQVIKILELQVGKENKKQLQDFLIMTLTKECLNAFKIKNNKENIKLLSRNLFTLSPQEFSSTIQKIIVSHVVSNSQILLKTINSVRTFPAAFEEVVQKGHTIYQLERILGDVQVNNNSNLLAEYSSKVKVQSLTPRDLFWSRISNNFKKEVDISYNRGGPVGKALLKNRELIVDAINKYMPKSSDRKDYQKNLETMLKSISVLTSTQATP